MKRAIKPLHIILIALLLMLVSISTIFAWFATNNNISSQLDKGTIIKNYFHCGSGTEEDPFVITRPVHFYNLVELYQRKSSFADQNYHFQLGYDLQDNGKYVFYSYDNNGVQIPDSYTTELNLSYYSGANSLLPIGTSDVPFDGTFNGNNLTVKNINIKAKEVIGNNTYSTSDVGIFGYVGSDALIKDTYFDGVTIDLQDTDTTRDDGTDGHNTEVHDLNSDDTLETIYVGFIAGHIKMRNIKVEHGGVSRYEFTTNQGNTIYGDDINVDNNEKYYTWNGSTWVEYSFEEDEEVNIYGVRDVYVNDCIITGGDEAVCGYGFFGCVENHDGSLVTTLGTQVSTLRAQGDDAGFGGSLDMRKILERLQGVYAAGTKPTQYPSAQVITIDEVEGTKISEFGNPDTTIRYVYNSYQYKYYTSEYAGKYYFYQRDDMLQTSTGYQFMLIYGDVTLNPKTVTTYTKKDEFVDAFYIHSGSNYLSVSNNSLTTVASEENAAKWIFDNNNRVYTYIEQANAFVKYYLYNNNGNLNITQTENTGNVWVKDNNTNDSFNSTLHTVLSSVSYYVDYYNGSWIVWPSTDYHYLSDGNNHYITGQALGIPNANNTDPVKWILSDPDGAQTTIYTYANNNFYYLGNTNETLTASTTSTTWNKDGNKYYLNLNGMKYYLTYSNGGWNLALEDGKLITDGSGNYLSATSSSVINSNINSATYWKFTTTSGDTQIYTYINGTRYYLTYNNGLTVSTTSATWHRSGNALYFTSNNKDYYLKYDSVGNSWTAVGLTYFIINDNQGHYLGVSGDNTFENRTEANATHFYFSDEVNYSGTAFCIVNGATYYLRNNNGVLNTSNAANATSWTNNGSGKVSNVSGGTTYYIGYTNNTWGLIDATPYTSISTNGNYLNANADFSGIDNSNRGSGVTRWHHEGNKIYVVSDNKTYYLRVNQVTGSTGGCNPTTTYTYNLELSETNSNNTWNNNGSRYYVTVREGNNNKNIFITFNNNTWTTLDGNSSSQITFGTVTPNPITNVDRIVDNPQDIDVNDATYSDVDVEDYSFGTLGFNKTKYQIILKDVLANQPGGYQTYFPLRIATDDEEGWYDANDPYRVSTKNTGYIVGGARVYDTLSDNQQRGAGDIRISYFPIRANGTTSKGIEGSYNRSTNAFDHMYSFNGSGEYELQAAHKTELYNTAADQLLETLRGQDSVYGLHFMDAKISKNYLVTAEKAMIFGQTFANYELPQDSITFNLIERGAICFFAGAYYTDNNTFFSLHKIYRNNDKYKTIMYIKEIQAVYSKGANKPFVYKYKADDDHNYVTYTDSTGDYNTSNPAKSLPDGFTESDLVFNTDWITTPALTDDNNKVYYFEIPANSGEYCLGSVSGKTGAYLIYLDIGTNGGDTIASAVSAEGNDVIKTFKVDFRSNTAGEGEDPTTTDHTILQLEIKAPNVKSGQTYNVSDFSIRVEFDPDDVTSPHTAGVYNIYVTNKIDPDLQLYVFLCDDDFSLLTVFPYAYQIIYTNNSGTNVTYEPASGSYIQFMGGFSIPNSGQVTEISYVGLGD